MVDKIVGFFRVVFPFAFLRKPNKMVQDQIDLIWEDNEEKVNYAVAYSNAKIEHFESIYESGLETRGKLEEKAKSTLFIMSIVITLFTGFISITYNSNFHFANDWFRYSSYSILLAAFAYMLVSTFLSLRLLGEKNVYYALDSNYYNLTEEVEKKEHIGYVIESNNLMNVIRNNYVNTAFQCIIISIFALVIFVLVFFVNSQLTDAISSTGSGSYRSLQSRVIAL